MNEKILVVDDEKEIADLLEVYLKNDNYIVHKYYNGIEALECIQKTEIDLAILDVMLPDIDGFRICQKIRENYYFPVIMLTAKIDDGDKIMGLTIGADDYITNTIVITFENFGNPIAEEKLKLIFEQFYRVDTSRNTTSGGAGLGLAIAKHIVELHKGTIVAHSKDECIKFIVTLPLS